MTGPGGRRDGRRRSGREAVAAVGERSPRTPEQERRAAERARRIRERRAAERQGRGSGAASADVSPDGSESGTAGGPGTAARSAEAARSRKAARAGKAARSGRAGASGSSGEHPGPGDRAARSSDEAARFRRRRVVAALLGCAVLLAALAAAGWWALGRFGPAVEQVRVTGNAAVRAEDVRAAAAVDPGTPLASVDPAAVEARVSGIPGVATAEVTRDWPHTLTVALTERTPIAVVDSPEGRRLVDVTGLAYRPVPPNPPRLPLLTLPRVAPDEPAATAAATLLADLPGPIRDQVDAVALGPGGSTLELVLTEGRRVLWGRWSETAETARKAAILGPLLSREGSVYDVSSPQLPTVRR